MSAGRRCDECGACADLARKGREYANGYSGRCATGKLARVLWGYKVALSGCGKGYSNGYSTGYSKGYSTGTPRGTLWGTQRGTPRGTPPGGFSATYRREVLEVLLDALVEVAAVRVAVPHLG